jgi:hypothetical protein
LTDAVPKKRGPKTDVLEALLKRVDGLEARLKEKKNGEPDTPTSEKTPVLPTTELQSNPQTLAVNGDAAERKPKLALVDTSRSQDGGESAVYSPDPVR